MRTRDEDVVNHLFVASTHSYVMVFSDRGRAYWLKVHEIPDVGPDGRGKAIANLVQMEARREDRRHAARARVRRPALRRHGHAQGHHQEDRALGLQQSARRRHHRHGHRGGRCGHRRAVVGRRQRGVHRHAAGHGDPLPRDRRAQHGPHGVRRARHPIARRRRGRGARGRQARRNAADGRPRRATRSAPSSTNTASRAAAASA